MPMVSRAAKKSLRVNFSSGPSSALYMVLSIPKPKAFMVMEFGLNLMSSL
ncbi:hypothetical protein LCGC14_1574320 [marine sediment metagenome]|uniref:Uncharacterized protein n=1 Tax=marine sediment metagenome TaxID=412755 RepID=A0A0F9IIQ5_9ZZZZ